MKNPVEAYPEWLKWTDIKDATSYSKTTVYDLIKEMEDYQRSNQLPEKLVHRTRRGRGIKINRDGFFRWYATREHMTIPEGLRDA
jgi:hypothetical protein